MKAGPGLIAAAAARIQNPAGILVAVASALFLFAGTAQAQESTSTLRGTVAAATPEELTVSAINVDTGFTRSVDVRADGSYVIPALPPGSYRVDVVGPGGAAKAADVRLLVGQTAQLNFDVEPSAEAVEEIVVVGQQIVTQRAGEVGLNITTDLIEALPQNNRNFLAFADLAPGVAFETGGDGSTRIQGGAQQSDKINVFIDGVGQKDYVLKNGITGQDSSQGNPFPQSAIAEYKVITQNYKAEFDQVSSAAITAVSRSGTNEFQGDIFWDYTDDSLRAKTPSEKENNLSKVKTEDNQFGISLGGPIVRDRLFFFFAYEGKRNETPVEVAPGGGLTPADLPPEYQELLGVFNREFEQDLLFAKLDYVPTDRDLFQFSVKIREETGLRWDDGPNAPSYTHDINNDETRALLRWERTSDRWINDVKLTYEDSAWNPLPELGINASWLNLSNTDRVLNVGGHPNFQDKGQEGFAIQDDFTWLGFDRHTVKAGIKMKWVELNVVQQNVFNPRYLYNVEFDPSGTGAVTFNDQVPYRVQFGTPIIGVGDGTLQSDNFQLGLYIQDDWLVTDRFELSYGIRWDYEETPSYLDWVTPADAVTALENWPNLDNSNWWDPDRYISAGGERSAFTGAWQPRIGFSYDLTDDGVYQLFGGYGRAYDRTQFDFIQQEATAATFPTVTFNFDTGDPDNPCSGDTCFLWDPIYLTEEGRNQLIAAVPAGQGRQIRVIDNDIEVPYTDQFSLGVRAFYDRWDFELGLTRQEWNNGFTWLLGNRLDDGSFFPPGATWGPPFGSRPPGFGNVLYGVNGLESEANSAYFKAVKPYDELSGWGMNLTYTYTDAEENRKFDEVFSLDYPSIDDYPVLTSAGVRKHRLVMAGNIDLPWGLALSGKYTYQSPPFVYGIGMPGDLNNMREPRVKEASEDFEQLDLALAKFFDVSNMVLRVRVDVLNVFDNSNYTNFIGNGQNEDFAERANPGIGGNLPRTFKFSIGLSF